MVLQNVKEIDTLRYRVFVRPLHNAGYIMFDRLSYGVTEYLRDRFTAL